ncbi:homeobox-domain-containing protein [Wolfiporia cocos MD-104 SS10]|uniref:Homeobox-domain-containing protein n=1 Tax=Wolfiporia cocos (strain MD-104) TaxID=742152 RepID=A0A2H3JXP3_WOLCO|nr:homeobox-domain-containing protein [Wolfiporia cocos MD-104 SS10]
MCIPPHHLMASQPRDLDGLDVETSDISHPAISTASSPKFAPPSPCNSDKVPEQMDEDEPPESPSTKQPRRNSTPESKEKRKRSRVTPEQLVQLEQFFATDKSPTAVRRKEISNLLGMNERQTQIWFQNRRAKAKSQASTKGQFSPLGMHPEFSTADNADLRSRLHEPEHLSTIPCTELVVGTWRRVSSVLDKDDLIACICDAKRCLFWYIFCDGNGFKIEVPFETVTDIRLTQVSPGMALASFTLSRPPLFYRECPNSTASDPAASRYWKPWSDWTENGQATKVLRHDLTGSAVHLSHVQQKLNASGLHGPISPPVPEGESRLDSGSAHSPLIRHQSHRPSDPSPNISPFRRRSHPYLLPTDHPRPSPVRSPSTHYLPTAGSYLSQWPDDTESGQPSPRFLGSPSASARQSPHQEFVPGGIGAMGMPSFPSASASAIGVPSEPSRQGVEPPSVPIDHIAAVRSLSASW